MILFIFFRCKMIFLLQFFFSFDRAAMAFSLHRFRAVTKRNSGSIPKLLRNCFETVLEQYLWKNWGCWGFFPLSYLVEVFLSRSESEAGKIPLK